MNSIESRIANVQAASASTPSQARRMGAAAKRPADKVAADTLISPEPDGCRPNRRRQSRFRADACAPPEHRLGRQGLAARGRSDPALDLCGVQDPDAYLVQGADGF